MTPRLFCPVAGLLLLAGCSYSDPALSDCSGLVAGGRLVRANVCMTGDAPLAYAPNLPHSTYRWHRERRGALPVVIVPGPTR